MLGRRKKPEPPGIPPADLVAYEFEIWYTYASFLDAPVDDLLRHTRQLVDEGIIRTALLSTGETLWRDAKGRTVVGKTSMSDAHTESEKRAFALDWDNTKGDKPGPFEWEVLGRSYSAQAAEAKLYDTNPDLLPRSSRMFPGACFLGTEDRRRLWLYPLINLYESGVIVVTLQLISGDEAVALQPFVDEYVNLAMRRFEHAFVPPAVAKKTLGSPFDGGVRGYRSRRETIRRVQAEIDEGTWNDADGDFSFDLAPVPVARADEQFTLQRIANDLMFAVTPPKEAARRRRQPKGRGGSIWTGRPYVHLIRHSEQRLAASENLARHAFSFTKILMRSFGVAPVPRAMRGFPDDPRSFEDVGIYHTKAAGLFAWSATGFEQYGSPLSERNSFIIEMQANAELVEHANMLAHSLMHAADTSGDTDRVLDLRERLIRLQTAFDTPSRYGEVTRQIRSALTSVGFDALGARIEQRLALRHTKAELTERRRTDASRTALTLVLGIIGAPAFGAAVVSPVWEIAGWPAPATEAGSSILMTLIAGFFIGACAALALWWGKRKA